MFSQINKDTHSSFLGPWVPLSLYIVLGLRNLELPGLYMDAVNPDYLAVWLRRDAGLIPAWIFPDNLLAPGYQFPLLNSLYGGSLAAYLYLIWGYIFGYGIVQVKLLHFTYGAVLVTLSYWIARRATGRSLPAFLVAAIIALEPSILFAWRTQFYLQLLPLIFFIPSLVFLISVISYPSQKWIFISGVLMGFSAYCYFTYFFFSIVAICIFLIFSRKHTINCAPAILVGFLVGWSPFVFAHLSIAAQMGLTGYLETLRGLQGAYGVLDGQRQGIAGRMLSACESILRLAGGMQIELTLQQTLTSNGVLRIILSSIYLGLLALQLIYLGWARNNKSDALYVLVSVCCTSVFAMFVFGALIGKPLGFQHYIPVLILWIIGGVCSGLALITLVNVAIRRVISIGLIVALGLQCLIGASLSYSLHRILATTGGIGNYSDAINRAAAVVNTFPRDTWLLFPQWGYWMGVVVATDGLYRALQGNNVSEVASRVIADQPSDIALFLKADDADRDLEKFIAITGYTLIHKHLLSERSGRNNGWIMQFARPSLKVKDWGPRDTKRGIPVNRQPTGDSAIWISVAGVIAADGALVRFGGSHSSRGVVAPGLVTAVIPEEVIKTGGSFLVSIEESNGRRTAVGSFVVSP
jgi:hypothetical protein